jgi:hypothetical protein
MQASRHGTMLPSLQRNEIGTSAKSEKYHEETLRTAPNGPWTSPPNETASLCAVVASFGPRCSRCPGTGYFSASTTYRRITLTALSRWDARSVQAFDL